MIEASTQALTILGISIPTVVWASISSAIIASVITLAGVLLTNKNSRKQLYATLKHEATQKNRERELLLRQEVYITTAEAIPRSLATLIDLSNLDIPMQQSTNELQMFSAVIAKIHMVGNNNTVQAVTNFITELMSSYAELSTKRILLEQQKNTIDELINTIENTQINDNDDDITQHEALSIKHLKEKMQFARECFLHHEDVNKLIPPILFSSRKELELYIDEAAYMKLFNNTSKKTQQTVDSFLKKSDDIISANQE